jgi:hypothetical protein
MQMNGELSKLDAEYRLRYLLVGNVSHFVQRTRQWLDEQRAAAHVGAVQPSSSSRAAPCGAPAAGLPHAEQLPHLQLADQGRYTYCDVVWHYLRLITYVSELHPVRDAGRAAAGIAQ